MIQKVEKKPTRMGIAGIQKGPTPDAPDFLLLYGVEGIGKSTFGADSRKPVFIAAERGVKHLDVEKFPEPQTWNEILESVEELRTEAHGYNTLVIDTLDWAALLLQRHVCKREGWGMKDFDAYGRGSKVWIQDWLELVQALDRLQDERKLDVILTAHAVVKRFSNPAGVDFDRYGINVVGKDAPDVFMRRADSVLFASWEEFTKTEGVKAKGVSTGVRVVNTVRTAAWDAKNRYDLPETLPMDWGAYDAARKVGLSASPADLASECSKLAEQVKFTSGERKAFETFLQTNAESSLMLAKAVNRLRARVAEQN